VNCSMLSSLPCFPAFADLLSLHLVTFNFFFRNSEGQTVYQRAKKHSVGSSSLHCQSKGKPYPPSSLQTATGLLHYMREKNPNTSDFRCKKNWRFRNICGSMESIFVSLIQQEISAKVKHTPIITTVRKRSCGRELY